MTTELERTLSHSRAAYRYAVQALPMASGPTTYPIRVGDFEFRKESDIYSMIVELGWAFFCRYEGCLEFHLKEFKGELKKNLGISNWLIFHDIRIPEEYSSGIDIYRKIRNSLHHDDGRPLSGNVSGEIHILPEHMENFYHLFIWIGDQADTIKRKKVDAMNG